MNTVLLGTTKGAFLLSEGQTPRGPFCDGAGINHVIGDPATGTIWAGGGGEFFGASVWRSSDMGESWQSTKLARGQMDDWAANDAEMAEYMGWTDPGPTPFDGEVETIWSLHHAHGTLYAGAKPANLYASKDGGESWTRVPGLADFPDRESWNPGGAGLVLHTILSDPDDAGKIWTGISAAGVFATEDGGKTFERRNRLSNEAAAHAPHPGHSEEERQEIGLCVHNMVRAPGDLIYQQNHHGVFRSGDGGRSWQDLSEGLPTTFGFPIGVDPDDPLTIWTIPLNGDIKGRFPPDAACAVWRSSDGGATWTGHRDGLPQEGCFFTVLRQAMATAPGPSIYFGTNSGSVFASHDGGESWDEIARHLPTILSVEVLPG